VVVDGAFFKQMLTWENLLGMFATAGLTGAVVATAIVWVSKNWISEKIKGRIKAEYDSQLEILKSKLKSESDVEVERLRFQLSIAAAERQFRFSRLHEKRADAIAEAYALLQPFVSALADYVRIIEMTGGPSREDRSKKVTETGNAFLLYYSAKKIFIPVSVAKKLDEILKMLRDAHVQFAYLVDFPKNPDIQKWVEIFEKINGLSDKALFELENDFRRLLGDEENPSS
jgi:hypothetical protein